MWRMFVRKNMNFMSGFGRPFSRESATLNLQEDAGNSGSMATSSKSRACRNQFLLALGRPNNSVRVELMHRQRDNISIGITRIFHFEGSDYSFAVAGAQPHSPIEPRAYLCLHCVDIQERCDSNLLAMDHLPPFISRHCTRNELRNRLVVRTVVRLRTPCLNVSHVSALSTVLSSTDRSSFQHSALSWSCKHLPC